MADKNVKDYSKTAKRETFCGQKSEKHNEGMCISVLN